MTSRYSGSVYVYVTTLTWTLWGRQLSHPHAVFTVTDVGYSDNWGRPIFHRDREWNVRKLHILHMSYPCMVISSIIGPRQRIYTEVSYPAMPRQVFEWLVWRVLRISGTCLCARRVSLDGVLVRCKGRCHVVYPLLECTYFQSVHLLRTNLRRNA